MPPNKKRRWKAPETDTEAWLAAMGFSSKGLSDAARIIGLTSRQAVLRNGVGAAVQWSQAERMAQTAAWLGLPPWSRALYDLPDTQKNVILTAARVIREAMGVSEREPDLPEGGAISEQTPPA